MAERRRRRWLGRGNPGSARSALPSDAAETLAERLVWWAALTDTERERLLQLAAELMSTKKWEAARGFELTDEVRLLIAAQAGLMALGLDDDAFDDVGTIIVHRSTVRLRSPRWVHSSGGMVQGGPTHLDGQAQQRGPVVISWAAARRELDRPGRGRNVVFHELAHKLDMLTPFVDGTPLLDDDDAHRRWVTVCTIELERVRRGDTGPLRSYAGKNPAEFFAVATEVFFDRPQPLLDERPELYEVLRNYYRQDPAERARHLDDTSPPTAGASPSQSDRGSVS